jgi:hypothetical protein
MGGSRLEGAGVMLQDLWGFALVLLLVIGFGLLVAVSWFATRRR